jgi:hypothetical protein
MSDLSNFISELENLIIEHAAQAGYLIAEDALNEVVNFVVSKLFVAKEDKK